MLSWIKIGFLRPSSALDQHDCAGVAGRIVPVWTTPKPRWLVLEAPYRVMSVIVEYNLGDRDQPCTVENPPYGASLVLRRNVFDKYGLFRTDLGPTASGTFRGEDSEYCRRIMSRGEKLMYVSRAVVFHTVPEERTTKRYFESWYFDYGRMLVRTSSPSRASKSYLGIPRYLLRKLMTSMWWWTTSFRGKRRFYHRLQVWQINGRDHGASTWLQQPACSKEEPQDLGKRTTPTVCLRMSCGADLARSSSPPSFGLSWHKTEACNKNAA